MSKFIYEIWQIVANVDKDSIMCEHDTYREARNRLKATSKELIKCYPHLYRSYQGKGFLILSDKDTGMPFVRYMIKKVRK